MFAVELDPGVWIAPWDGDPGRTLRLKNAQVYGSAMSAMDALDAARKYRPFERAAIFKVRKWEVRIPCICDDVVTIFARSSGKAKAEVFRDARDAWPDLKYTDVKVRLASIGGA